jgi:plastocyanin
MQQHAIVLALLLSMAGAGEARTPRRVCRAACRRAIDLCAGAGARRAACRRRLIRRCRREGVMACEVAMEPFTTTTSGPTTSTTSLPAGPTVNGCNATHATDLRGDTDVTVQFGVGVDIFDYAPECIIVTPGTRVTFSGSFATHPLVGGEIVGDTKEPDPASPFGRADSGSMRTFELDTPGTYGYYCDAHGVALHMWGAVIVAP